MAHRQPRTDLIMARTIRLLANIVERNVRTVELVGEQVEVNPADLVKVCRQLPGRVKPLRLLINVGRSGSSSAP